jgi:hypothetical protein
MNLETHFIGIFQYKLGDGRLRPSEPPSGPQNRESSNVGTSARHAGRKKLRSIFLINKFEKDSMGLGSGQKHAGA